MSFLSRLRAWWKEFNTIPKKPLAGPFRKTWMQWLGSIPEEDRPRWEALTELCVKAEGKSKPTLKWLAEAKSVIREFNAAELGSRISTVMAEVMPDPFEQDPSLDIVKGLVWLSPLLRSPGMAGEVGRFADKCFRKVPNKGARSTRLANAALWALAEMPGDLQSAAELFRLREKIKYPSARKTIEARLSELAIKTGETVEAMEDRSLPAFGLDQNSMVQFSFGEARAEVLVRTTGTHTRWFNGAGKPVKSVPVEVRSEHGEALLAFRKSVKEIETARSAQALRLEQGWLEGREWVLSEWRRHFLDHALRRPLVSALLWRIEGTVVLPVNGELADVHGLPHTPSESATVTLWHPLDSTTEEILAWRARIIELGLTQPFKQAHREVYVITDAERATRTYSNRFAAHILRQHVFRAVCQARGWRYNILGAWDGDDVPTKALPKQGLTAQYLVDRIDDNERSEAGVVLHLTSDRVLLCDEQYADVEIETISPIVFSEMMRDVDLFVAVSSVAYDPSWSDGGPDGRYGQYWRDVSFGELSQTAATRRDLIASLAPKLSIADRLEVTERFLVVRGREHEYAIHFGSSNIQILPQNRYLCIVPTRAQEENTGIVLPFAGDGLISTILAKAFLLVDESKIRDPSILRQL